TRCDDHACGGKAAAGQGRADIPKTVDTIRQGMDLLPTHAQFVLDVQHTWRRHHQVRFHIGYLAQHLQHAHGINGARGACYANDQPARRGHSSAPASFSTVASSPFSYISAMMSEPPMNSPFTYSCGMVGQSE